MSVMIKLVILLNPTLEGFFFVLAFFLVLATISLIIDYIRFSRLAKERAEFSICQFARSFDYRRVDTKIIRAAYEGLQAWAGGGIKHFPVMATDDIGKLYGMVDEDLDDFAKELAEKTGRDWDSLEQNPLYGKVITVRDLVLFVNFQPRHQVEFAGDVEEKSNNRRIRQLVVWAAA